MRYYYLHGLIKQVILNTLQSPLGHSAVKPRGGLGAGAGGVRASKLLCFLQFMKCFLAGSSSSPAMKWSTLRNFPSYT